MQLKLDNIRLFDDLGSVNYFLEWHSNKPMDINLDLGETQLIFDDSQFEKEEPIYQPKPLFPENKIKPIHLSGLNKNSLIIVRLEIETLLYDSIVRPSNINVELKVSSHSRLTYLFFGFEKFKTFSLKARKAGDEGLIKLLKKDLLNTNLRQYLIDLMMGIEKLSSRTEWIKNLSDPSIKEIPNKFSSEYRIEFRESSFEVTFGNNYRINLPKIKGIQLIMLKLKNPDIVDPILIERILFDTEENNVTKSWSRCETNYRNALLKIEELEREKGLTKNERFSEYIDKSIKFKKHHSQISFLNVYQKPWDFKGFPSNYNISS